MQSLRQSFFKRLGIGRNGEDVILKELITHVELSIKASSRLLNIISLLSKGSWEDARKEYQIIDSIESEADETHRETVEKLSSGVFFAGLGADMMNLAEKIDGIADSAKDAARTLIFRRFDSSELASIEKDVSEFLNSCIKAVYSLQKAVEAIGKGKMEVIASVRDTEMYEEEADEIKNRLLERLFQLNLPVLSTIQLKDFIFQSDNIADYAEDAGDILYILVAKGYY